MTTIVSQQQQAYFGDVVTLFQLDCTSFDNGAVLYFCSTDTADGHAVTYAGNTYTPVEIEASGFEYNGQAAFPNPTLRLSNVNELASALVIGYNDLMGATVRRIRTLSQFLDNGATPDPLQTLPIDVFQVEQKTKHTQTVIEWKLSASVDQQGRMIPSLMLVRDYCSRIYRYYDRTTHSISYAKATCPYTGSYYDVNNNATTDPSSDRCPKTLTGCKTRFGAQAALPFKACPGLSRLQ